MNALLAAAGLAGLISATALSSAGFWAWNTFVDNPGIVRFEQAKCALAVEAAAAKAVAEEQLRQFRIGEAAFDKAFKQDAEDQAWQQARVKLLQSEIADYERERQADGRSLCPLTRRDLEFLDGVYDDGHTP
jgi:hypothetical protein